MVTLDNLDRSILQTLQVDADITFEALGKLVHASAATCQRRVARLKEIGAIEKVVAVVNPKALAEPLIAISELSLVSQTEQVLAGFEQKVLEMPFVQQCYRVSTGPDFVLVLALPNMAAYHALASDLFTVTNDVRNVRTFFSILRSKFSGHIPV